MSNQNPNIKQEQPFGANLLLCIILTACTLILVAVTHDE